jgi:hypothetical protein
MSTTPSPTPGLFAALISDPTGILILGGITFILAIFIVPLFLPTPEGWRAVERRVAITDFLFTVAFTILGAGFLSLELMAFKSQWLFPSRSRLGLSALCFAIAGRRTIFAKH